MSYKAIIVYDGDCAFCNSSIRWVLHRDKGYFKIAHQHTPYYKVFYNLYGTNANLTNDTICLVLHNKLYVRSNAVIQILKHCGKTGRFYAFIIRLFPLFLRDGVYKLIARHRKRLANKFCKIVNTTELKNRLA